MSSTRFLYQVDLRDGSTRMTCWVDREVLVGQRITLKNSDDPGRWWTVEWASHTGHSKGDVVKEWQVGGL